MNKSLRFLAIGLALAVLLVSQVGVDRSAVAHQEEAEDHVIDVVDLNQDDVSFTDSHGQEKDYYKYGDTVHFVLRDNDLAQDTSNFSSTVTWALGSAQMIVERSRFNLVTGAVVSGGDASNERVPYGTRVEGSSVTAFVNVTGGGVNETDNSSSTITFIGTDLPKGPSAYAGGFTSTTTDQWQYSPANAEPNQGTRYQLERKAEDAMLTPLVGDPTVRVGVMKIFDSRGIPAGVSAADKTTVRANTVFTSSELILRRNLEAGTFTLLEAVAAAPTGDALDVNVDGESYTFTPGEDIFTVVEAKFNYHIVDVFNANQADGTGAEDDENRALVTTSSFPSGKWVTISEVKGEATDVLHSDTVDIAGNAAPTSSYYYGSIKVVGDSGTGREKGNIWARDGDSITIEFFESDHTDVIGDTEAIIDAVSPSISEVDPDGVVLNETPVISFGVSDMGSGFSTSDFEQHVDLYLLPNPDDEDDVGCKVKDAHLSATRLSSDEMSVQFRSRMDWGDDEAVECENGGTFQAKTNVLNDNNHGDAFGVKVVAFDVAGNKKTSMVTVTIDNEKPRLRSGQSVTGKAWDADEGEEVNARNSIKLVFDESLDPDTVGIDDFEVENPDADIEAVTVGGANVEGGEQQKNEIVYLTLDADLSSDDEPKVEIIGAVSDLAGNEQGRGTVGRLTDRIGPEVTVDALSAQLLAEKGEATVSFIADESMSQGSVERPDACTCLSIAGGGGDKGDPNFDVTAVTLPTPKTATYTFKQGTFKATGIYGVLVQATDSSANEDQVGEMEQTDTVTAMVAEGAEAEEIEVVQVGDATTSTSTAWTVTVALSKWPLADIPFDGSLEDSVTIKGAQQTKVTEVNWRDGQVTLQIAYAGEIADTEDKAIADGDELVATYNYVVAEQVIEVDIDAPEVDEVTPPGNTQNGRPFITIKFDETEYAGDTHKTVVVNSATLTDEEDNETVLVDADNDVNLLSTSDNILFSYLPDSDLPLGEYTISVIAEDDAGNVMDEAFTHTFKVVARLPVTIPLNLGWNLISLPGAAADSSIDAVINVEQVTQVLTYDPTVEGGWLAAVRVNGGWEGGLTDISAAKAYLVYTTSVDDLKVDIPGLAQGDDVLPPTTELYEGWNMVASSSLNPGKDFPRDIDDYLTVDWSRGYYYGDDGRLVGFTPDEQDDEELVKTGRGFLIYVTKDGTQVP